MGTPEWTYSTSHPWITFRADLSKAEPDVWMLLFEARSKVDQLALALLRPAQAEALNQVFLARGVQATTAIEGNALGEAEVAAIVAGRAGAPPPSQAYLYREVENIVAAFNHIKDRLVAGGSSDISPADVEQFNREVLEGLDEPGGSPGELRRTSVFVGRYRGAPAEDCEHLLARLCDWLNGPDFRTDDERWKIPLALIKATVAHLYIAWIHPFDNGNGRTARLIELQILLDAGVPLPAAHLPSYHYNATRAEYHRQLEATSGSGGDIVPFVRYAAQGFVDGIRGQIERVWEQQYADRWEQFIHEAFGGNVTSAADRRRLQIVLKLSEQTGAVARRDIPRLTPELTIAYAGTERMLSRDINALEAMGLIEQAGRGYWRPQREQILAFRPLRREAPQP